MDTGSDILPRFTSKAEFLAWEEQQEARFEFDGEDVIEVNGCIVNHFLITRDVTSWLHQRLRGTSFLVIPQVKVETVPGYRYPDVSVGSRLIDRRKTTLPMPVVVFEVLSPSTARIDLGRKRVEYGNLASIRRYVVLDSDRMAGRAFAADGSECAFEGPDATIDLPELNLTLPLSDCYEDVTLDE